MPIVGLLSCPSFPENVFAVSDIPVTQTRSTSRATRARSCSACGFLRVPFRQLTRLLRGLTVRDQAPEASLRTEYHLTGVADPAMVRHPLVLEWRDNARKQLPHYRGEWLRPGAAPQSAGEAQQLWCDVLTLRPKLRLPWAYSRQQEEDGDVWECGAVWLHCAGAANGAVYQSSYLSSVYRELQEVLAVLHDDPTSAQHTLLVTPSGMEYDQHRMGGDHVVREAVHPICPSRRATNHQAHVSHRLGSTPALIADTPVRRGSPVKNSGS